METLTKMVRPDREAGARIAGWVFAAMVAVVAICAVTFMITTRPTPSPLIATTQPSETLRGALPPSNLQAGIARAQASQAAAQANNSALAAAEAAQTANVAAAEATAMTAERAGRNASAAEPVAPPLPPDWTLRGQ